MKTFKDLLKLSIIQSLLPLAVSATFYLFGTILSHLSTTPSSYDSTTIISENGYLSFLTEGGIFLKQLACLVFQVYDNFFQFISMMFLFTTIAKIKIFNGKSLSQKSSSKGHFAHFLGTLSKELFKRVFIYSLIYCTYQGIGITSTPSFLMDPLHSQNLLFPRILDEQTDQTSFQSPNNEELSLSVGHELNNLHIDATAMILSADGKLLYAASFYMMSLKIIDISNIQTPTIISSFDLVGVSMPHIGTLYLTEDGQTLFATDNIDLQIINVSNPKSPFLIGSCRSKFAINDFIRLRFPNLYKPAIEISKDKQTLFAAGSGLQIFNISNLSNPTIIFTNLDQNQILSTSLALSPDASHLLLVNKALEIHDISSDPTKPVSVKNFTTNEPATSMILTRDKKIAYILCRSKSNRVTVEKIDVSNPTSPSRIKLYKPSLASLDSPVILAISPCDRYLFISLAINDEHGIELKTFDTVDGKVLSPQKSMIQKTDALLFVPDTNYLISSLENEEKMRFFELFPNFTKRKVFSLSELKMKKSTLKENANSLQFSSDHKTAFISTGHIYYQELGTCEIINVTSMTTLGSYTSDQPIFKSFISSDNTRAVLQLYSKIEILNISNLSSPTLITPPLDFGETNDITRLLISQDLKTAIVAFDEGELSERLHHIRFFNISNTKKMREITSLTIKSTVSDSYMVLSQNENTLFLFPGYLIIYDLSNIKDPNQLANLTSTESQRQTDRVLFCLLSPDEKVLAVRIVSETLQVTQLKFFNVSNLSQPSLISEIILPEEQWENFGAESSAFSRDKKILYVAQIGSLLAVDISDVRKPKIFGIVPNSGLENDTPVSHLSIEPDGNTANVLTETGSFYQMDLRLTEISYMKQESFKLGVKYLDTLAILAQNSAFEFELLSIQNYKLIKSHLINFEVEKSQNPIKIVNSSLPDWVTLEKDNVLTIEAKSRNQINSHIFCSGFSHKVPVTAFKEIEPKLPNTTDAKDLIATLISAGYLDSQLFVTSNFGNFDEFYLPKLYRDFEQDIYQMINNHYRETCTKFDITPSLELEIINNKFSIKTPSASSIKLQIELQPRGRFLSRSFDLPQSGVRKNSSTITFEDSLKEINLLLQQLVIDLPTSEPCNGTITINDHLNYPLTKEIVNISKYFFENKKPEVNKNLLLQDQINNFSVYTGQYFIINIHPNTFIDNHTDHLSYSIVVNNKERSKIPSWLTFNYPDLKGTPPEDFMNRNFEFLMIIKNEFKHIEVPFKLHAQISLMFGIKLAIKNSPYILTLVGFIVYASKIYNLFFKKYYRHKKDHHLKNGEEITSNIIFPVMFIAEEMQEKKLIWKYFLKTIALKLNTRSSPNKYQIVEYFLDELTGDLDKRKLSDVIQETLVEMPDSEKGKLHLYQAEDEPRKARILQLFINVLVEWQLDLAREQKTKKVFDQLKDRCYEFVECSNLSAEFTINHFALQQTLKTEFSVGQETPLLKKSSSSLSSDVEENLLENDFPNKFNIDLLQNALIGLVFKYQSVNSLDFDVNITVFRRQAKTFIHRFFNKDLLEIGFQSRGKLDYGFDYKITNSVLYFFGTPNKNFNRKTVVVQIANLHQRIHKEIWIYGSQNQQQNEKPSIAPIIRESSRNHNEIL